jgi:hypothetical protein
MHQRDYTISPNLDGFPIFSTPISSFFYIIGRRHSNAGIPDRIKQSRSTRCAQGGLLQRTEELSTGKKGEFSGTEMVIS